MHKVEETLWDRGHCDERDGTTLNQLESQNAEDTGSSLRDLDWFLTRSQVPPPVPIFYHTGYLTAV